MIFSNSPRGSDFLDTSLKQKTGIDPIWEPVIYLQTDERAAVRLIYNMPLRNQAITKRSAPSFLVSEGIIASRESFVKPFGNFGTKMFLMRYPSGNHGRWSGHGLA
jgi:hypothetical protein